MKKFLVIYMAPIAAMEEAMKNAKPEDMKASMDGWMKWGNEHKAAIVDMGAPLGKTKRVYADGSKDAKNDMGGYSVVQAESAEAAAKLFGKDHPHFQMSKQASIEIVEIMPMPGM